MLRREYLVRGAITRGALYHDDAVVVGPALVRAYELESQVAIYPRIILDPNLQNLQITKTDVEDVFWTKMYREDRDGIFFLNFLSEDVLGAFEELKPGLFTDAKKEIRKFVRRMSSTSDNDRVRMKYDWLKSYIRIAR